MTDLDPALIASLEKKARQKRVQRLALRRLTVDSLRSRGLNRVEARRLTYKPSADAHARQERATRATARLIAHRWGIPRQKKEAAA